MGFLPGAADSPAPYGAEGRDDDREDEGDQQGDDDQPFQMGAS